MRCVNLYSIHLYANNDYNYNSKNINLFDPKIYKKFDSKIRKVVFLAGDPRIYYYENRPEECFRNNHDLIKNIQHLIKDLQSKLRIKHLSQIL